jgi:hypothetical protein
LHEGHIFSPQAEQHSRHAGQVDSSQLRQNDTQPSQKSLSHEEQELLLDSLMVSPQSWQGLPFQSANATYGEDGL